MSTAKRKALETVEGTPDDVDLAEIIRRLYALYRAQQLRRQGDDVAAGKEQPVAAELRSAWTEWSQRGPQGPISDEDDHWP